MNKAMKNQIVIYSIVLMLVVAGYLSYIENDNSVEISANTLNTTNIGDATLVNNNEIQETEASSVNTEEQNEASSVNTQEQNEDAEATDDENSEQSQIDETNTTLNVNANINKEDEYFANSKLEREKMYSQMLETYQKILENSTISEEQKSIASTQITNINNTRNAIMICENLIAIKGFEEAVILANGESVNVVIKAKELSSEEIAQIQNIITREMGTNIENIHIMKK